MHTTTDTTNPELLALREQLMLQRLRYRLTMLRVQTKALETLERLMDDPEPSGNEKTDKAKATERNRQRLAANQTLIHCRTAERERRLAKSSRQAIEKHNGLEPNRASDGWQAPEKTMLTDSFSPRGRRWSCANSAQDRMRGRPEPFDNSTACTTSHGLRPIKDRTQTMPPKKVLKPQHPRRSRKRKNRR